MSPRWTPTVGSFSDITGSPNTIRWLTGYWAVLSSEHPCSKCQPWAAKEVEKEILDSCPVEVICRFINHSYWFMSVYWLGLTGQAAEWAATNKGNTIRCLSIVMHQTRLVQWTWNVLLIQDYPGVRDECDPHSSHPSYENPLRWRRIPEEMTILERVMTTWCLEDITPLRTSQEAEEMKEKWKRKVQIMFLAPNVKFKCPMLAFWIFEYLIHFWSYQACDYIIMKPRTWPTCWSSSDKNQLSSHGDIHPAIQTFHFTSHYGAHITSGMLFRYCCRLQLHPTWGSASLPDPRHFLVHPIPSCSPNPLCSQSACPPPQSPVLHILWSSQVYCQAREVLSGHYCVPWAHCLWSLSPAPLPSLPSHIVHDTS